MYCTMSRCVCMPYVGDKEPREVYKAMPHCVQHSASGGNSTGPASVQIKSFSEPPSAFGLSLSASLISAITAKDNSSPKPKDDGQVQAFEQRGQLGDLRRGFQPPDPAPVFLNKPDQV